MPEEIKKPKPTEPELDEDGMPIDPDLAEEEDKEDEDEDDE